MERAAERQAEPEDDRDGDQDGSRRDREQNQERGRADPAGERQLGGVARSESAGEGAQQVGDERRRRQGGEAQRLEAAAPRDGRQDRVDEGHRDAHAHGHDQIEGEIAPDRASRRGIEQ